MNNDLSIHYVCTHVEAENIIRDHQNFWVSNCGCREEKGECLRSRMDVCLLFEEDETPSGTGKHSISLEEALSLVTLARESSLVTRPFRSSDRSRTNGICFCCDDCCGYFQNRDEHCDKGRFIESTNLSDCVHCGACVIACNFGARRISDGLLTVNRNECCGCGLCAEVCPAKAITMVLRS